jgi:HSP20 family protein
LTSDDDRREKRRREGEDDKLFRTQFEAVKRMIEELMERLGDKAPEELFGADTEEQLEDMLRELQKSPMVWGFSAAIGPDGRVQLNPFGNVSAKGQTPTVREEREPLVEVMDQEEAVIVVAELPGVAKDDVELKLDDTRVTIRVDTPLRKYAKTIDLPAPVKWKRAKVNYTNGILELRLPKH